jgi:hypothetical protein
MTAANGAGAKEADMTTRFTAGDKAFHNGRPVVIAGVDTRKPTPLYSVFYADEQGGVAFGLLGRVLSTRG